VEVKLWPGGPSREPDVLFVAHDGPARVADKRVEGAPALVIEVVSPGSVTLDRITKFREYEQAGVGEYWIIDPRPHQQQADFYVRDEEARFVPAPVGDDGVYHCAVIPGFRVRPDWFRLTGPGEALPDAQLPLAEMLAEAPGLPDELRAAYSQLAQLLGEKR
jgi:Uma2 family endonuclease